jgi:CubicO group peptidase (beta-lactamase class C family)
VVLARDGQVVLIRGYGVRTAGRPERIDEHTVFAIASLTKAFTAAGAAVLFDEQKLTFNDPATKYLPALRLYDSRVTAEVNLRDLLAQRTCLQPKDLLTWNSPFSHEETLRRVQFIPPACTFRDRFVYNNINYVVAGDAIAAAAGTSWHDLMTRRIFNPLDMRDSTTLAAQAARRQNLATPYLKTGGILRALPLYDEGVSAPAGSIHSTAADMAKWLEVQMGGGVFRGKTIWSPTVHAAMQGVQMAVRPGARDSSEPPTPMAIGYGMGWGIGEYRGKRYVDHTGQSDGMYAQIAMMPSEGLGIVVLTNTSMVGLPEALAYRWFDINLGAPDFDWINTIYAQTRTSNDALDIEDIAKGVPRTLGTRPSLPAPRYAGAYKQDLLGEVTVTAATNGDLSIRFLGKTGRMRHWQDDTFQIDWGADPYLTMTSSFVTFQLRANGPVESLKIGNDQETFTRE